MRPLVDVADVRASVLVAGNGRGGTKRDDGLGLVPAASGAAAG